MTTAVFDPVPSDIFQLSNSERRLTTVFPAWPFSLRNLSVFQHFALLVPTLTSKTLTGGSFV